MEKNQNKGSKNNKTIKLENNKQKRAIKNSREKKCK